MLVSMKAPGPSIERSTWLSAARCMTTSISLVGGAMSSDRRSSQMSACDEAVVGRVLDLAQGGEIAGIGELVDIDDMVGRIGAPDAGTPPSR